MRDRCVHEAPGLRTYVAIFETGDEVTACLEGLAEREGITGAAVTGIGAFCDAVLAYFDWDAKDYVELPVAGQVEVAALAGDIGVDEAGKPAIHIHLVLGRRDGTAVAGHLRRAHVRPTLELVITETPAHLRRHRDPGTGLNLIRL